MPQALPCHMPSARTTPSTYPSPWARLITTLSYSCSFLPTLRGNYPHLVGGFDSLMQRGKVSRVGVPPQSSVPCWWMVGCDLWNHQVTALISEVQRWLGTLLNFFSFLYPLMSRAVCHTPPPCDPDLKWISWVRFSVVCYFLYFFLWTCGWDTGKG